MLPTAQIEEGSQCKFEATRSRGRRIRGASGVEYVVVVILVAIAGITGYKALDRQYRCKVNQAFSLFSGSPSSEKCDDSAGPVASSSPGPSNTPNGSSGPSSGVVCVGSTCTVGSGSCFVAGTLVVTEAGAVPIEQVTAGTRVLARDQEGDAVDWRPVARTFVRATHELVELTIGATGEDDAREVIDVTPNHRVRAKGRGWIEASALVPGRDVLIDAAGRDLSLLAGVSFASDTTVFNLEIDEFHTYFVGQHSLWVHNDCNPRPNFIDPPPEPDYSFNAAFPPRPRMPVQPAYNTPQYPPPPPNPNDPRAYIQNYNVYGAMNNTFGIHVTPQNNVPSIMLHGLQPSYGGGNQGLAQGVPEFEANSQGYVHFTRDGEFAQELGNYYQGGEHPSGRRPAQQLTLALPPGHPYEPDPDSHDTRSYRTTQPIPPQYIHNPGGGRGPSDAFTSNFYNSLRSNLPRRYQGLSEQEIYDILRRRPQDLPPGFSPELVPPPRYGH